MDKYVIHWKSKLTGETGNGLYSLYYETAFGLLSTLKKEDKTCWFWLVRQSENREMYV